MLVAFILPAFPQVVHHIALLFVAIPHPVLIFSEELFLHDLISLASCALFLLHVFIFHLTRAHLLLLGLLISVSVGLSCLPSDSELEKNFTLSSQ